ncbi:hypothetical protein BKA59DRAFT_544363 [Fusarium tricinctum]|uniref:Uncharacterized protein n=1 Tax=Fusarium tricinctum TaxID=61284 RepID=A0A8K0WE48_9HYPO|nr:hypothetical protein BKA59DRAFT_544363 [Fusarium tricinctum]
MADKVEEATEEGKGLCTATLLGPGPLWVAIVVYQLEENGGSTNESDESSELGSLTGFDDDEKEYYIFTSFRPAKFNRQDFDLNDVDKHVSIEVDCDFGMGDREIPRLIQQDHSATFIQYRVWLRCQVALEFQPLQLIINSLKRTHKAPLATPYPHTGSSVKPLDRAMHLLHDLLNLPIQRTGHFSPPLSIVVRRPQAEVDIAIIELPGGQLMKLLEYATPSQHERETMRPLS